jgi:hypothetical protein
MRRQMSVQAAGAIALAAIGFLILNVHTSAAAEAIDSSTAVRGSLGVSLEDLAIHSHIGDLTLYLNGGLALLCVAIAAIVARSRTRKRNGARRTAPVTGAVRATMGETWARLSRPLRG